MIPSTGIDADVELTENTEPSMTYKLFTEKIQGNTDNVEALQQAIYKVLSTERYEYPIYSFNYGVELESLIGQDAMYVKIELKRRIQECLLQDERIQNVDNFVFGINGDEISCTFDVKSIYGEVTISKEVNI